MRRAPAKTEFSMFPFLSVLCCVIGVLTMFIMMTLSTRVIEAEAPQRPDESQGKAVEEADIDAETYNEAVAQIAALRDSLAQLQDERQELQLQYEELREQLDLKKLEAAKRSQAARTGREIGKPLRVIVQEAPAGGEAEHKKPMYLEVTADSFVLRPEGRIYPKNELKNANSPLADLLRRVYANRHRQYLALFIHPEGVSTYHELLNYFMDKEWVTVRRHSVTIAPGVSRSIAVIQFHIDFATEPFSGNWVWHNEQRKR